MKLYSRGRPNEFGLAKDDYKDAEEANWPKTGAAYWASPLEGIFASSPYFHNGSVRTLWDVLTPPAQRPKTFRTGSNEFDVEGVGLRGRPFPVRHGGTGQRQRRPSVRDRSPAGQEGGADRIPEVAVSSRST